MTEKERASILLEAVWEALYELGVTDRVSEEILIPAILKTDGDLDYARKIIAEMQDAVPHSGRRHANGAPMFAADGMMLDDQGNRSIFDDVDA